MPPRRKKPKTAATRRRQAANPRKRRASGPSHWQRRLLGLAVILVVGALGFVVVRSVRALPIGVDLSALATWGTLEQSLAVRAFVVRQEQVVYAPATGTVRTKVAQAELVRPGQLVVELVDLAERRETEAQLAELDRLIRGYEEQARRDSERITQELAQAGAAYQEAMTALGQAVLAGPLTGFSEAWSRLSASARLRAAATQSLADIERRTRELQEQREQLLADLQVPGREMSSPVQALVSFLFDGLEGLQTSDLRQMEPAAFLSLRESRDNVASGRQVTVGDAVFKMIAPAKLELVSLITVREAMRVAVGERVIVRFPGGSDAVLRGVIAEIGEPFANGTVMIVVETEGVVSGLAAGRWTACELVFSSRSGVIVPRSALANRDGQTGVLVLSRTSAYFRPVTVLAGSGHRVLVHGISAGTAVARYPWLWHLLGRARSAGAALPELVSRRMES